MPHPFVVIWQRWIAMGVRFAFVGLVAVFCSHDASARQELPIFAEEAKLLPIASPNGQGMGRSLAFHGDTLVAAAMWVGNVYVFTREAGQWAAPSKLVPSATGSILVNSVAIEGETVFVGSPNAHSTGSVFVFALRNGAWTQVAELSRTPPVPGSEFGWSVAVSGRRAVVGARGDGPGGKAYVFARSSQGWIEEAALAVSGSASFGFSVAIQDDLLVVGAPEYSTPGAVHVFRREGVGWVHETVLQSPLPDGRQFGWSVALDGDTVVVGAQPNLGIPNAHVFARRDGTWAHEAQLTTDLIPGGHSVAVCGDVAVVGAPREGAPSSLVFVRTGTKWSPPTRIPGPSTAGWGFGVSVAVDARGVVVGSFLDQTSGTIHGAVHAYRLFPAPVPYCSAKPSALGCALAIGSLGIPSATGDAGFAVTATSVRNRKEGLLLYSLAGADAAPFHGGTLCIAPPVLRTPSRDSLGNHPVFQDCSGGYRLDMNAFAAGLAGGEPSPALRVPGAVVHCQWWARDPTHVGAPAESALTDALRYVVGP